MTDWARVTENLILQNSNMVVEHGGRIGATDWSYRLDDAGVRTIDPGVGFYVNPPPYARCRWSTNFGQRAPQHITSTNGGNGEVVMPARQFVQWNQDTQMLKFNEYREQHWEDLKNLVRPNNFEDLFDLFDASTLWANGAYNMWLLVNMLVTHAHNEFPQVLQEWKVYVNHVIQDFFRANPSSTEHAPNTNQMQLLHNQLVLTSWDQMMDPLLLLQRTNFPIIELSYMNVQQHGLFRDSLISEHARLTRNTPAVPVASDYAPSVNKQVQSALAPTAVQAESTTSTPSVKPCSPDPVIAVGTIEPTVHEPVKSQDMPESATLAPRASPPTLDSIPEESAATKGVVSEVSETTTSGQHPTTKALSLKAKPFVPGQVEAEVAPEAEHAPPEVRTAPAAEQTQVEITAPQTESSEEVIPTVKVDAVPVGVSIPDIVTREATPTPDSPIRDRKDSNGSTDKLFFPDAPSNKLHVARQASVTSAPDFECAPILTVAEKVDAQQSSKTPLVAQVGHDQRPLPSRPNSVATPAGVAGQGSHQFPVAGRTQGRQHSGPMDGGGSLPSVPQQGPYIEPPARHTSLMLPPNGPPNAYHPFAPHTQSGPNNGFIPYGGPPVAPGMHLPMGQHVGPHAGTHAGFHLAPHATPHTGAPFQDQMLPHLNQHQYGPHGPQAQMNVSPPFMGPPGQGLHTGYQSNGYDQQPQNHGNHYNQVEKGNVYRGNGQKGNGYGNNGYRHNSCNRNNGNTNYQRNGKRHDSNSNQSSGDARNRGTSNSSAVNGQPRQVGGNGNGLSARRSSTVSRPDQNMGRGGPPPFCNNRALRDAGEHTFTNDVLYEECPCHLCQKATRSLFVSMSQPGVDEQAIQLDLLRHFALFNPIHASLDMNRWNIE